VLAAQGCWSLARYGCSHPCGHLAATSRLLQASPELGAGAELGCSLGRRALDAREVVHKCCWVSRYLQQLLRALNPTSEAQDKHIAFMQLIS